VLKAMWTEFGTPKLPVPDPIEHYWALSGVPHMYRPRRDYWNSPTWTYVAENKPLKETLERKHSGPPAGRLVDVEFVLVEVTFSPR
jgi:hypothetical protein